MSLHFVTWKIGIQRYALPLSYVERALRMIAITPVPKAPAWVAGAVNVSGKVIPVVDLRQPLGHPGRELTLDDRLLVIKSKDRRLALIVDSVHDVLSVPAREIEEPLGPLAQSPLLAGIIQDQDLILVLDAEQLLPADSAAWGQGIYDLADWFLGHDDLQAIKGVGPVLEEKLRAIGVGTFDALARADAPDLAKLLGYTREGSSVIQSWIDQAAVLREKEQVG